MESEGIKAVKDALIAEKEATRRSSDQQLAAAAIITTAT